MNATPSTTPRTRPFAVVTGASTGIGLELARCCAHAGHDLLIVADEARIEDAAEGLRALGVEVTAMQTDLATLDGVDRLAAAVEERPVDVLIANAGRGLGKAFLDQEFDDLRHVLDTNVTGTIALLHRLGRAMRTRGRGRILVTGSIAGFMPGAYQAVYNGSKAFLDSFAYALREELKDSGVSVTCLMPGPTDTEFFARADLLDTQIGTGTKDDPAKVARMGFDAMMSGKPGVVTGARSKAEVAMSHVIPQTALARKHAKQTAPGSAYEKGGSSAKIVAGAIGGLALLTAGAWVLSSGDARARASAWRHRLTR